MLYDTKYQPNQYGCEPFNRYTEENPNVGDSPFILVKKGLCSYTTKVRNIEEAGGHVAIIINDKDEKVEDMFLADDGHEGEISIPAILISKADGEKIINYYLLHKDDKKEINKIRFEIKFDIENKNNTVNFDIWYTPDIENVYTFLKDFQKYYDLLENYAKMSVHFVTYPHFQYDENSKSPKEDCLGSGKYCIRPGKLGITDGSLIVSETIRQKCIFDKVSKNDKVILFFKFMERFHEKCILKDQFNQICSNDAIYDVGINLDEINDCIYESFSATSYEKQQTDYQKIAKNQILDKEYEVRKQYLISRVPSITINGRLYIGAWKPEFVFEALCSVLTKKPSACYTEGGFKKEYFGFTFVGTFLIILVVLFINVVLFVACKRYIEVKVGDKIKSSDIDRKIDTVVNSYIQLRDTK